MFSQTTDNDRKNLQDWLKLNNELINSINDFLESPNMQHKFDSNKCYGKRDSKGPSPPARKTAHSIYSTSPRGKKLPQRPQSARARPNSARERKQFTKARPQSARVRGQSSRTRPESARVRPQSARPCIFFEL